MNESEGKSADCATYFVMSRLTVLVHRVILLNKRLNEQNRLTKRRNFTCATSSLRQATSFCAAIIEDFEVVPKILQWKLASVKLLAIILCSNPQ